MLSRSLSTRSEEHTSELQSRPHLVCRLLLEKKNKNATKLIDLPILSHRQEWGSLQKNTSVENNKLTVNKKEYEEGFGMHAASATSFLLDKPYQKLSFYAGLDDESLCGDGISVEVLGD